MNRPILNKETWNKLNYQEYLKYLKSLKNESTIEFNKKIITTKKEILGIKTKELRNIAKEIAKGDIESFIKNYQDIYFEESLIYGFVIGYIKDVNVFLKEFNNFIKYIDNWAICDMCISSFKIMKTNDLFSLAKELIASSDEFRQRTGIIIMLDYYLNDKYIKEVLAIVKSINSSYYYVNMAISWLLCESFIKYKENTLELISSLELPRFIQNKTISKINDSYRVVKEDKLKLKEYII